MNWESALHEIESREFDAKVSVASSMSLFFNAVREQPAVLSLYEHIKESGGISEEVLGRIYDLSQLATDPRFENPRDTALATLLWLLSLSQGSYAELAAHYVDHATNCWYAKKLARALLLPVPVASGDSSVGVQIGVEKSTAAGSADETIDVYPFASGRPKIHATATMIASTTAA